MQRLHRNKIDYDSADYYENFKQLNPEIAITQATHTKILKTFSNIIIKKIVLEMFRFPITGMGQIYLIKKKVKVERDTEGKLIIKAATNWKETRKIRSITGDKTKKVVYLNEHTNGYIYQVKWDKGGKGFTNRTFYAFKPSRNFQMFITQAIKSNVKPLNAYSK